MRILLSTLGALVENPNSIWKESLNFSHTPNSQPIDVDSWHHRNGRIIPYIQREVGKSYSAIHTNIAIAGIQCVYTDINNDTFGITKIIDLPKLFISGYRNQLCPRDFQALIERACISTPEYAHFIRNTYDELYGLGNGYIYTGTDTEHSHLRAYMEQNFNLWLGEKSCLSNSQLRAKLQIIKKDGISKDQFAEHYFHSEQAILSYLESEAGIDFLFQNFFSKIPKIRGKPQITQLVLHVSSYYDVCETCADTLFRESEAGRMFLQKLESRLKARYYLYPHNRLSLLIETSGALAYTKAGKTTRPAGLEGNPFYMTPIVTTQTSPYVMRMKIGEKK